MAWYNSLKDLTGDIKSGVTDVGHAVGEVASNPLVDAGIGAFLGPGAAAAAKGLGTLIAPGGNVGKAAVGAGEGYLLGKGGQLVKSGVSSLLGTATPALNDGFASDGTTGTGSPGGGSTGLLSTIESALSGAGGDISSVLGKLNSATGGGNGLQKLLLAAAVADQAATRERQTDLQNKGLGFATDAYNANAPLRTRGAALLAGAPAQDLSSIFTNPENPYTKSVPSPRLGTAVPAGGYTSTSGQPAQPVAPVPQQLAGGGIAALGTAVPAGA